MARRRRLVLAFRAAAALAAIAIATTLGARRSIEIDIRYSQFRPASVTVPVGVPVTIVLRNDDPIDHEWIVGDATVHEHHRTSAEVLHSGLPTEVSVPALSTVTTTVTFASPDRLAYICHLPGHEAYGMVGWLTISQ